MISITFPISYVLYSLFSCVFFDFTLADSWNPIRHRTEEAFFQSKSHERSTTLEEMNQKIQIIRDRRHEMTWNSTHPFVQSKLKHNFTIHHHRPPPLTSEEGGGSSSSSHATLPPHRPNILFLFADDLGFGDLSVSPFRTPFDEKRFPCTEGGILTPHLEQLAKEGVRMTNFHSSAPVCSPARTSAMTGLYSWRMTAMNAFELGRDPMQRNGFLPQIPTTAEVLRENGYFTVHSGKWHLGGMREEQRKDRVYSDKCSRPSPNQHGFEEYISELDGPESPRYTFLLSCSCLHTKGHRHLIKDDVPVPIIEPPEVKEFILSDREAGDAIDYIRKWKETNPTQPWFIQVWFNAPHGPWEVIKAGEELYNVKYNTTHEHWQAWTCKDFPDRHRPTPLYGATAWSYKTMVSAMDRSIGQLMNVLKELDLEKDTLIVFTSDNGHENGAGNPAFFKEGKRSLMEGGVRVPAIWKWKGMFPENSYTTYFGGLTDLFPTFLQAAHIPKPSNLPLDGISLLPILMKATPITSHDEVYNFQGRKHIPGDREIQLRYFPHYQKLYDHLDAESTNNGGGGGGGGGGIKSIESYLYHEGYHHFDFKEEQPLTRVFLWHKDTDPFSRDERVQSAGYYDQIKMIASGPRGCIDRIFDMKMDPTEDTNLFVGPGCKLHYDSPQIFDLETIVHLLNRNAIQKLHCTAHTSGSTTGGGGGGGGGNSSLKLRRLLELLSKHTITLPTTTTTISTTTALPPATTCEEFYHYYTALKVYIILKKLVPFIKTGNYGHMNYLQHQQEKVTCQIPIASNISTFEFVKVCPNPPPRYGCSSPEY